jgi:hypothetical protein
MQVHAGACLWDEKIDYKGEQRCICHAWEANGRPCSLGREGARGALGSHIGVGPRKQLGDITPKEGLVHTLELEPGNNLVAHEGRTLCL